MTTIPATIRERIELPGAAPPSAHAGPGDRGVTVGDVMAIVRRRWLMIVTLFLLSSTLATGGWLGAYYFLPLWPGEAFVECISDKPKIMSVVEATPESKEFERFVLTQTRFVEAPDVLMEALQTTEVRGTTWYKQTPKDRLLLEFMELITASPDRGTNLLKVSVATRDPKDPHLIVNQVVRSYMNRVKEYNTGEFRQERDIYQKELETTDQKIIDKQKQLAEMQRKLPPGTAMGTNTVEADFLQYRQRVTELTLQTQELQGLWNIYNLPTGPALSPEDVQLVEMDPKVSALSNQLFGVMQQIHVNSMTMGESHRAMKRLKDYGQVMAQELRDQRERRLAEILAYRKQQVHTALLNSQHALTVAAERLADAEARLADVESLMTQYMSLDEDLLLLKQNREVLSSYLQELERIVRERSAIRVELRQEAMKPLRRSFPQFFLLPAGFALSMVFAVGLALLVEYVDTSLRTPQDMVRHLRIPLLGVVPDADDEEVEIEPIETAVRDAPQSMFVEVFRAIRTNLQFSTTAERQRSLVITSPRPEDGKTTIACNLAMMLAQGGRRVLLVDANFRRPAIHRFFKVRTSKGLSNILVADGTLGDCVTGTDIPNLDVLGSGRMPPNPAELVGSPQMQSFIAEVISRYDQVIFDAPPVLLASDASVLASRTDGAILVCRARSNSRGIGGRACALLNRVDAHIFGGILNAAQIRRGGYFREQLRTFYDYRLEEGGYQDPMAALPDGASGETGGKKV